MSTEQNIPWDPIECHQFIVEVVGNQERFPEQYPYATGRIALLQRLLERYGEDYFRSCSCVLRNFLENPNQGTLEERALWHGWRSAQADRVVSLVLTSADPGINSVRR